MFMYAVLQESTDREEDPQTERQQNVPERQTVSRPGGVLRGQKMLSQGMEMSLRAQETNVGLRPLMSSGPELP